MKKTLATLSGSLSVLGFFNATAADLPSGSIELSPAQASQTIDSAIDNGSFSVTFALDAAVLKEALAGKRTQVVDAHLNAGRKPKTDVGYAIQGGNVYYTYIQYFADQFTAVECKDNALEKFVSEPANVDSITGGVITIVHATYHDIYGTEFGSHYYLNLYTTEGVKTFTGFSGRLKISDRKLGTVSIPKESPATSGFMYAERALTADEAALANAKLSPARP